MNVFANLKPAERRTQKSKKADNQRKEQSFWNQSEGGEEKWTGGGGERCFSISSIHHLMLISIQRDVFPHLSASARLSSIKQISFTFKHLLINSIHLRRLLSKSIFPSSRQSDSFKPLKLKHFWDEKAFSVALNQECWCFKRFFAVRNKVSGKK